MKKIACLIISVFFCGVAIADDLFEFQFEEIATDVWVGVRPDGPRFPVMGNTTFVIGSEGVVVFDGGGAPAMADQLIEKIRSLTDQPVTHVVTSHWHGDHNFGVYRFAEEFDNVQFIAHRFTAEVMDSPRIAYIDRSATFYERNTEVLESAAETGKDAEGNDHIQLLANNKAMTTVICGTKSLSVAGKNRSKNSRFAASIRARFIAL